MNDEKEYIEVDFYVMGVYRGKRKISKNSISGAILSGDLMGGISKTIELQNSIDEIIKAPPKAQP